jgi:hypothetical protein
MIFVAKPAGQAPKVFQIAAAVIGNALEWYDFIVFGFLTVVISRLFFPTESQRRREARHKWETERTSS